VAVIVLTAAFSLYFSWVVAGARSWLPTALRLRTPRAVWVVGLAVGGALAMLGSPLYRW
jgi:hypothetical protein